MLKWAGKRNKAIGRFAGRIRLFPAVFLALCGGLAVAYVAYQVIHRVTPTSDAKAAPIDITRVALTVVAGVGGVVALVIAYRRQRDLEQSRFVERFGTAAAQLGATDVAVRIAGVYAMAGVADESDRLRRQQCIDVLCGYLRLPYNPELGGNHQTKRVQKRAAEGDTGENEDHFEYRQNDHEVRATIIRVIADHLKPDTEYSWSASDFDFRTANLEDVDFHGCAFSGTARFDNATFRGIAGFGAATFHGTAGFGGATFHGTAGFGGATFHGTAGFGRATFHGTAGFGEAFFRGDAWFGGATFSGDAGFVAATLHGNAGFDEATFHGDAGFVAATFHDTAGFDEATFHDTAGFGAATFHDTAGFVAATFHGTAWFGAATLHGDARFEGATFHGTAVFGEATFQGDARFGAATFHGTARFDKATISGNAWFGAATFHGNAGFDEATFHGDAWFDEATFHGDAWFDEATFHGDAGFVAATFSGDAWFDEVVFAGQANFVRVDFGSERIAFTQPRQWGPPPPEFDWGDDGAGKPANVEPQDWPPVVATSAAS